MPDKRENSQSIAVSVYNKTMTEEVCVGFKEMFPEIAVEYFVS